MSLAVVPVQTFQALDPLTRVSSSRDYAIVKGGDRVTYKPINSTSWSNATFSFTAPPPSPGIIVDRKIALRARVRVTFTGTTTGGLLLQTGFDAPRANCLSSVMTSMSTTLNNTTTSINIADVIHPLMRYNMGNEVLDGELSVGPQMQDEYQRYPSAIGTVRNSLGGYGDNDARVPRGAFPFGIATLVNTTTAATVEFEVTEFIYLSPYMWGKNDKAGFIGVQTMDFTFNFGNLNRIWSHSVHAASTITGITATFYAQPTLLFKYVTPRITAPIPQVSIYPFYKVQRYPTSPGIAVAPNASTALNTQNIQLNSIPLRIYLCARKQKSDRLYTHADTYFRINSVSVNWDNNSGLLASASLQDLFRMSKRNGLNYSFPQYQGITHNWAGTNEVFGLIGSVLCICPGIDIALHPDQAPGQLGTFQLQIDTNVTNVNQTDTITPELMIIIIEEGTWTIMQNQCISQIGVISKADVVASDMRPHVDFNDISDAYGGNFWSGLKSFGEGVLKGIQKVAQIAAPIIKTVGPMVLPLLGLGEKAYARGGAIVGGARKKKRGRPRKRKGGMLVGGQAMSRAQLRRALMG